MVFWTKEISLPHFIRYRVRFRRVWSGNVDALALFINKRKKINVRKEGQQGVQITPKYDRL